MNPADPTRRRTPAEHSGPSSPPPRPGYLQPDPGPAAGPTDAEARAHMRRAPGHELTVGSDDQWHCLTCEGEEER